MSKKAFIWFGIVVVVLAAGIPFLVFDSKGDANAGAQDVASKYKEGQNLFEINCGTCTNGQTCGGGANHNPNLCGGACVPNTACPAGDNCGSAPDGCGGMLNCGSCAANQVCTKNVCTTLSGGTSSSSSGTSVATAESSSADRGQVESECG